ncbi:MAG: ferrous iron transport protein B [Clostridiales bacterium]|jgi:ferrous iron transport protein B|nr:ferrous iron transport protein B [Clostridiales bacterium]
MRKCGNCEHCGKNKKERRLVDVNIGESVRIKTINEKKNIFKKRLLDMGFVSGTIVTIIREAPLGDPIVVKIRENEISLRKESLKNIIVEDVESNISSCHDCVFRDVKIHKHSRHSQWSEHLKNIKNGDHHNNYRFCNHHHNDKNIVKNAERENKIIKIVLAGNPNSGKTTVFNKLTGSNQYVGNWPGVTVEKKEGFIEKEKHIKIIDLPGVYSLSPYSIEEVVTRDYIIGLNESPPNVIINVIDATNLERNLYLTIQLIELERPMVIALNFMDEAKKNGIEINTQKLTEKIGISIMPIIAKNGENLEKLLNIAKKQVLHDYIIELDNMYGEHTQKAHYHIGKIIYKKAYKIGLPVHWSAISLLENDHDVEKKLNLDEDEKLEIKKILDEYKSRKDDFQNYEPSITNSRYSYIEKIVSDSEVIKKIFDSNIQTLSNKIDKILTHKLYSIPTFILTMFIMFITSFGPLGTFLSKIIGNIINFFSISFSFLLKKYSVSDLFIEMFTEGIIKGIGGVLTFIPQISLLFLFLSIMEDSGYMSRVAFIMDKLFKRFGLSGKSFIPMLMGFGCSVPAVMGTRAMENEKDRQMTIFLIPFMSCSAKLPVYGLIASAFFGSFAGFVIFSLYMLGIIMAIVTGLIFSRRNKEASSFIMELPPYRIPSIENILRHVKSRLNDFLVNAGTLIFSTSVILWFLQNFDLSLNITDDISKSILTFLGEFIAPIFRPLGFGTWQASVALLTGLIAKEAIVVSLSMFYGFSLTESSANIASTMSSFSPLSAFIFLVFISLYIPCVAAVSAIYIETKSIKWTLMSIMWQLCIAYLTSFILYQFGKILGFY